RDTSEKRAFESGQTGLQVSLYRLNMLLNSSATNPATLQNQCTGADSSGANYVVENPSISGTYCAPYTESLGNGAFHTSWTSVACVGSSGACAGVSVGT